MVMYAQPIQDCCREIIRQVQAQGRPRPHIVFMTAAGSPYSEETAKRLARCDSLLLVCGHYEGIDERVIEAWADEEISIGDYVLTGGELGALVIIDAVARLIPGVLGCDESSEDESFSSGLLEYPQYTRPREFRGLEVPEVLLSGDHAKINRWRRDRSLELTYRRRPELLKDFPLDKKDKKFMQALLDGEAQWED